MSDSFVPPVRFLELEKEKKRNARDAASAQPLGQGVKDLLRRLAPAKGRSPLDKIQQVRDLWKQTVGEEIARRSIPRKWREGVLTVTVDSAPLAAELQSFGESALITTLVEGGLQGLHSIRFQSGKGADGAAGREGCEN